MAPLVLELRKYPEIDSYVTVTAQHRQMLDQVLDVFHIKPDIVLVHGATTTTFAGSLAAFYHQFAVGHVEAGLRTGNKYFPFPEELNRQMTGAIADLHFAPTGRAKENLLKENKKADAIFVTGNTAIDALRTTVRDGYSHPVLDQAGEGK